MFGRNLRSLHLWRRVEEEVDHELDFHMEMRAREYESRGMDLEAARERARRRFGDRAALQQRCTELARGTERSRHRLQWLDEGRQDARYALRQLARHPVFTTVAVLTLAIGIGANTAIFSVLNTIFFRDLPFADGHELIRIYQYTEAPDGSHRRTSTSGVSFQAVSTRLPQLEGVLAHRGSSFNLGAAEGAERVSVIQVSDGWAKVLGIVPTAGRTFTPGEESQGVDSGVAIVSHALAVRRYGSAPAALGQPLAVDDRVLQIVGVFPAGFRFPYDADLWVPCRFRPDDRSVNIFGRLREGVGIEQVNSSLAGISVALATESPQTHRNVALEAVPAREALLDDDARMSMALMAAVGFVLLIACANVSTLLVTRFVGRQKEIAVRAALGGGRARQLRQFVTETLLLFGIGAAAGLMLTFQAREYLAALIPPTLSGQLALGELTIDRRVLLFTMGLTALCGLVFGALAAVRASRADIQTVLRDSGRSTPGRHTRRTLESLVTAEVALALVLLVAAALMVQSLQRLQHRDLGFDVERLLTMQIDLTGPRYGSADARLSFADGLQAALRALPGVTAAGITTVNPVCCGDWGARVIPEGMDQPDAGSVPMVHHRYVTPTLFSTMGMRLMSGRVFTKADREGSLPVVIIDERMARHYWPGQDPVGRRVKRAPLDSPHPWLTIVGVVSAVADEGDYDDTWYLPFAQGALGPSTETFHVMVRTAGDPALIAPMMRPLVARLDSTLGVYDLATMADVYGGGLARERLGTVVLLMFGAFGVLLSSLGIYGTMSHAVQQRQAEIGIRMALGASAGDVLRDVVGRGARVAAAGIAIGLLASVVASSFLSRVLFETPALHAPTLVGVSACLGAVTLLACLVPGLRALKVDPVTALR